MQPIPQPWFGVDLAMDLVGLSCDTLLGGERTWLPGVTPFFWVRFVTRGVSAVWSTASLSRKISDERNPTSVAERSFGLDAWVGLDAR